ncbi:MAG: kinase [Deltaproteobacteria bacterium]|nr:kinase [Deltaproteobacteria bacterium]
MSLTMQDGQTVEFIFDSPKQGSVKDVYFSPDKKYVVAFYRKDKEVDREKLDRLVGNYRRNICEKAGGEYFRDVFRWPQRIVEHNGQTGIVVPFYDKKFFFPDGSPLEGCEKEGYWFTSPKNFNRTVPKGERGNLKSYLQICASLSRAVKRLHANGLAHSDLSYKNCLVDPSTGSACVIDIDGLVVPGFFAPDVLGTPDFIAPEVVMTQHLDRKDPARKLPCAETDLHALAVLIYSYLFHRHPLRGSKVWDHEDEQRQEALEMGERALFIEHPTDPTNRRRVEKDEGQLLPWIDTQKLPFTVMGPHLKELFLKAFVDGLHAPRERPTADDWFEALVKTVDRLLPCANPDCPKGWFVYDGGPKPKCPYCGRAFPSGQVPFMDFSSSRDGRNFRSDNHRLVVYNDLVLSPWHVRHNVLPDEKLAGDQLKPQGYFSLFKGKWFLTNLELPVITDEGTGMNYAPKEALLLYHGQTLRLSNDSNGRKAYVSVVSV